MQASTIDVADRVESSKCYFYFLWLLHFLERLAKLSGMRKYKTLVGLIIQVKNLYEGLVSYECNCI
jgi:hypothetical protein